MKRALLWSALSAGLVILGFYAWLYLHMAIEMQPFGGIPFSVGFFRLNPQLVIGPTIGLVLAAAGLALLPRDRR